MNRWSTRYGLFLAAVSLAPLWLALRLGDVAFGLPAALLLWCALAFQFVSAAYLVHEPRLFGKHADGRISVSRGIALAPYRLIISTLRQLARWGARPDPWNQVAPGVYVGRWVSFQGLPPNTDTVVDLTCEFEADRRVVERLRYLCIPTLDGTAPSVADMLTGVEKVVDREGTVYVHCAAGYGRSATFAATLLVARGHAPTVKDAIAQLKSERPNIHLNFDQRTAAQEVARRFSGRQTAPDS